MSYRGLLHIAVRLNELVAINSLGKNFTHHAVEN